MEPKEEVICEARDGRLNCPTCGYNLEGLPAPRGVCPECGVPYRVVDVSWFRRPGPGDHAVLKLAWPLIGLIVSIMLSYAEPVFIILVVFAFTPAVFINTPIMVVHLTRKHLHPAERSRSFLRNMARLGAGPLILVILNMLAMVVLSLPLLALGACLIAFR